MTCASVFPLPLPGPLLSFCLLESGTWHRSQVSLSISWYFSDTRFLNLLALYQNKSFHPISPKVDTTIITICSSHALISNLQLFEYAILFCFFFVNREDLGFKLLYPKTKELHLLLQFKYVVPRTISLNITHMNSDRQLELRSAL